MIVKEMIEKSVRFEKGGLMSHRHLNRAYSFECENISEVQEIQKFIKSMSEMLVEALRLEEVK